MLCFHSFGLIYLFAEFSDNIFFLRFCVVPVSLDSVNTVLQSNDFICTVYSETVNFFLNFSDIIVDRLTQLPLFFSRKNLTVSHIRHTPSL